MTVEEIMKILKTMPKDAVVCYLDTWWESEGWGENSDVPQWEDIGMIKYDKEDNIVELW